jgi:glycosyltransferase involved in cell wall biosynthesis
METLSPDERWAAERLSAKPRILVIANDKYPPFRVDVAVLFGRELSARGYSIDWILQSEAACDRSFETAWGGGTVYVGRTDTGTSLLSRLRKHCLGLLHDLEAARLIQRSRYEVVQVRDKVLVALPVLCVAKWFGAAFVYWLTFPHPEASLYIARIGQARYPLLYRIRGWVQFVLLYKMILPLADHIFVQSEQMKRDLQRYGVAAQKMTPVPMGVELQTFSGVERCRDSRSSGDSVIAYLGTLAGERRIEFLVRCLELVIEREPRTQLLLVGDGARPEDTDRIRREAQRLGVEDRVRITGFLPQREALALVATATVCVSPFYPTPILNSTSPTKLVEYMALGMPVVANDHPEQKLVIERSRAGYCVPYEESVFADAIVRIIRDPQEAAAMGVRGREYVAEHRQYSRIADLVAEELRRIANSTHHRLRRRVRGSAL